MRRRAFMSLGGAAVVLLLAARAALASEASGQRGDSNVRQPAMPVIGFLSVASPDGYTDRLRAFRQGLKDTGHVEAVNVAIEYRWAENQIERLPALAGELVRRDVAVIVAASTSAVFAVKAATTAIPVAFVVAEDPVRLGLVSSLARPGANMTGLNFLSAELVAKRLELMRELVPAVRRVAVLVNHANTSRMESTVKAAEAAARSMGLQIELHKASTSGEIDTVFAGFVRERPDALVVGQDPFFTNRRVQLANLAAHRSIPSTYGAREIPEVGGLMSYGASLNDAYRQLGVYAGRILKGTKPADLPVEQSSKFELVINAQTARMLGLTVPASLLAVADEVIE
jgi:putative tryptophan/tyrosine transport system substrate-binding protein